LAREVVMMATSKNENGGLRVSMRGGLLNASQMNNVKHLRTGARRD
jgi:hypothetical protein